MNWNEEPMTVRRFVWLVGWVIVALMVLALLLVLFNTIASSEGHETGMVLLRLL
jgi:cell division protein FtsX